MTTFLILVGIVAAVVILCMAWSAGHNEGRAEGLKDGYDNGYFAGSRDGRDEVLNAIRARAKEEPACLAKVAYLINQFGPDSLPVLEYIDRFKDWDDFYFLANLSRDLKKALKP